MAAADPQARLDSHPHPGRSTPPPPVVFQFEGEQVQAFKGDTIASALYASGVRIFSRSFKYHRPRGLTCVAGRCPNCLMTVDGVPNVRACVEPARDGAVVRGQNAWPSIERDALSVMDRFGWAMPVGFYYKSLHRPRLLWKAASPLIRRVALAWAPSTSARPPAPPTATTTSTPRLPSWEAAPPACPPPWPRPTPASGSSS